MARSALIALFLAVAIPIAATPCMDLRAKAAAPGHGVQTLSYGNDRLQTIDYWPGRSADSPLIVFVHGGGWSRGDKRMMQGSDKLRHWQSEGYAVVSINYRLVPDVTVEDEAGDVAAAVAYLWNRADVLAFDGKRIALIGHSAGAHLVALVGTDPNYLQTAGLSFADIAGVVPLDGAAYDVAAQLADGPRIMRDTYSDAFGSDPARQTRLSPTLQATSPNAPAFLILHVQRPDGTMQSNALAAALRNSGTRAEVLGFAGQGLRGHMEINRRLGDENYPVTAIVDAFFDRIFSQDVSQSSVGSSASSIAPSG